MINTAKHTPGPWKAQGKTVKMIDHSRLYTVATVHNKLFTQEANEANARLIAAAPELLEALKNLVDQAQEDTPVDSRTAHFETAIDDAFAAIAKATGQYNQ